MNVPKALAIVIRSRLATRIELDTVYGVHDLYDFLEIIAVDANNEAVANRQEP